MVVRILLLLLTYVLLTVPTEAEETISVQEKGLKSLADSNSKTIKFSGFPNQRKNDSR